MGRKRRQRSTAIRKRIEKKQREEQKQRRRAAKRGKGGDEIQLQLILSRKSAEACSKSIQGLEERLVQAPIRGWTVDDLSGDGGLSKLAAAMDEELDIQPGTELTVLVSNNAQRALLDKLITLELAAPGLGLDWDEGFPDLERALKNAEPEPVEEDEEESSD